MMIVYPLQACPLHCTSICLLYSLPTVQPPVCSSLWPLLTEQLRVISGPMLSSPLGEDEPNLEPSSLRQTVEKPQGLSQQFPLEGSFQRRKIGFDFYTMLDGKGIWRTFKQFLHRIMPNRCQHNTTQQQVSREIRLSWGMKPQGKVWLPKEPPVVKFPDNPKSFPTEEDSSLT